MFILHIILLPIGAVLNSIGPKRKKVSTSNSEKYAKILKKFMHFYEILYYESQKTLLE